MTLDMFAGLKTIETLQESHVRTGIPRSTLHAAVWTGGLRSVKRGGTHWVDPAEVDRWIAQHRKGARRS
jgi:hypothetical protein